jgi:hemoglobin
MRKFLIISLLLSFISSTFPLDAEARKKRRKPPRKKRAPIINEKKLYERIGGEKRMSEIVQEWIRLNLEDPRVASSFAVVKAKPENLARLHKGWNEQMCEISDGPCKYNGPDLQSAYGGIKIDETQFLILGENLFQSMEKFNISEREKNEMMGRLGELRAEMVEAPESES